MTKTMTFAAVHFSVAFSVGYALTGSVMIGGAIAMLEPAVNTLAYYLHERVWERINRLPHQGSAHHLSATTKRFI